MADSCSENIEQARSFVRDSQQLSEQKEELLENELKEHREMQR